MKHRFRYTVPLLTIVSSVVAACSDVTGPQIDPKAVAYSFAVVGCNRVDTPDTTGNVSTANVPQLQQTFREIAAQKPNFLFFAGDLVFGYTNDTLSLARQLNAWVALWESSPAKAAGVELVMVPGNHETQNLSKVSTAAGERTWLRAAASYLARAGNGPGAGGADSLQTDQSRLTWSFNFKDAHFVLLNTDPTGADWSVPVRWVAQDVAAAKTAGQKHIFAIGHKPAYPAPNVPTDGLNKFFPAKRDALWSALTTSGTEAMLAAHNHMYWAGQPVSNGPWQIIAGNGGSKLEGTIDVMQPHTGAFFGYTLVQVLNDGTVIMKSYGRNVPIAGYLSTDLTAFPTTLRDSVQLR